MNMIRITKWAENSGKISDPCKTFFLKLASKCVRLVNNQRVEDGISYAKATIITRLALNTNGECEASQLTPDSQRIINKRRAVFDPARSSARCQTIYLCVQKIYSDFHKEVTLFGSKNISFINNTFQCTLNNVMNVNMNNLFRKVSLINNVTNIIPGN